MSEGVRGSGKLSVTVGEQVGSISETISFYGLAPLSNQVGNIPSTGSVSLTVHGFSFGMRDRTTRLRVGGTGCETTGWLADTAMVCLSSVGTVATRRIGITVGETVGSETDALSYDVMLSTTLMANVQSTGSVSVTVAGSGLGGMSFSAWARMGHSSCEASDWESDSSVRCLSSAGVRGTVRVGVTVGEALESMSESLSYALTLSSLIQANAGTTGSVSVTVAGMGLGGMMQSIRRRVGQSSCEASEWVSDSSVRCMSSSGVRGTLRLGLTVGDQAGSLTEALSYGRVEISTVNVLNRMFSSSTPISMRGSSFGLIGLSSKSAIGFTACEASVWESDTAMRCRLVGSFTGTLKLSLTSGASSGSMTQAMSYDGISVSGVHPQNLASTGSVSVTISGATLGLAQFSPHTRVGPSACETTDWTSATAVRTLVGQGWASSLRLGVTLGERVSTRTDAITYDVANVMLPSSLMANLEGCPSVLGHGWGIPAARRATGNQTRRCDVSARQG
eukprot:CAMPEP_0181297044 /NCGR_PEP_ID=MMETSP1101-20121128/5026_1 /TAXON_ID=46948 /ORGANISM="Rhodomonas abbreviata, Strain Caron Lab Isolate" /LENGTH=505 /DNA_ID=CAMNT_0023401947 /DNA_START=215 /DNA_END=1732 /DNA_ORIENTATION=+